MRILACWDYARPNLLAPLEGLVERGHEVIYLSYRTATEEPDPSGRPANMQRLYWRDFRSGQHLLDEVRPDCVLMMGTEGAWTISTIFAARQRGIPTVLLQHGVSGPVEGYAYRTDRIRAVVNVESRDRTPALAFVARSMASRPAELARTLSYLISASRTSHYVAAPRNPVLSRRADRYLVASQRAAAFHLGHDHVDVSMVRVVGLAEFDAMLQAEMPRPQQNSALLIDTPHTGTPQMAASISPEAKLSGLKRLSEDLGHHGWHLTVKLHPASYRDRWASDSDTLTFKRDVDIVGLVRSSDVVLGFTSTLVAAAMKHRPTILLRGPTLDHDWFGKLALETGAVDHIRDWRDVTTADILHAASSNARTRQGREAFVEQTIGPPDGRALDRLESELVDLAG